MYKNRSPNLFQPQRIPVVLRSRAPENGSSTAGSEQPPTENRPLDRHVRPRPRQRLRSPPRLCLEAQNGASVRRVKSELDIRQDVPLAPLCSLELGGAARYLVSAPDEESVKSALRWAERERIPAVVVGGGTNLVVADRGFDGLVVLMRQQGTRVKAERGRVLLTAMAGQKWDTVVEQAGVISKPLDQDPPRRLYSQGEISVA